MLMGEKEMERGGEGMRAMPMLDKRCERSAGGISRPNC
jgi:hypothetical protein